MIYNLISSPRNVSTAMMYAFHHRGDMLVFDEPYYGYYLHKTGAEHPGRGDILQSMTLDPVDIEQEIHKSSMSGHVFLKNMAHHYVNLPLQPNYFHLFLIRDPLRIIHSFSKVIAYPTMRDVGVQMQFELFREARDRGHAFAVVDSSDLLKDPASTVPELCKHLGLSFSPKMLRWTPGAIERDGIWAKYWYHSVHQSDGLKAIPRQNVALRKELQPLYEECLLFFEKMSREKISL